jgi:endoglucanase
MSDPGSQKAGILPSCFRRGAERFVRVAEILVWIMAATVMVAPPAWEVRAADEKDAFYFNRLLGRGVNLGNALDAPVEGAWGVTLKPEYFEAIKDAGFNSVRIPIRWSAHAITQPSFAIDPEFLQRVDWAIDQALSRNLVVVIDVHHFVEMDSAPEDSLPRLVAIWTQIAQHYRGYTERLYFELLNEPHDQLTDERWQEIVPVLLSVVRGSNPTRMVLIGPAPWNGVDHLDKFHLSDDDRNLIVTFHYYNPLSFTHQEASWVEGSSAWKDTTWAGTVREREELAADFDYAAAWGERERRPLYLGEFGAYEAADMASRVRWTRAVVEEAEKHGFSWAYWEFCSGFGVYDPIADTWREPLLRALIGKR